MVLIFSVAQAPRDIVAAKPLSDRESWQGGYMTTSNEPISRDLYPLAGRTVVVTGVSRRAGIGHAIAARAAAFGANLVCQHFSPHDAEQAWGADSIEDVMTSVRDHLHPGGRLVDIEADFTDPAAPTTVIATAIEEFGRIDGLVCNQAASGLDGTLDAISSEYLDRHWAVNARASMLLAQAFARQADGGSIVFMTSGQGEGPMPDEVAYATSKAALAGITPTLAAGLADRRIRVNTVNPGPIPTGWMSRDLESALLERSPFGRLAEPDDPARLITWLLTDEASWITGQVISSEGGFRRHS